MRAGPLALALGLALLVAYAAPTSAASRSAKDWKLNCADPALGDAVIEYTPLYGAPNLTDSAWHDDTWAFMQYGPITAMSLYYSVLWHDPYIGWHPGGEFKGIQPVYGTNGTDDLDLLFGAKKPHKPFNFTLAPGEKIVKVVLQHDEVMRWISFTTNLGNKYEWGYKDYQANTTTTTSLAPRDGAYLAAFRGFEGKQLPQELGGYKKRYIIQLGFVWAMPNCTGYAWTPPVVAPPPPSGFFGLFSGLFGQRRCE
ncbi:hypothetical protein MNEG_11733 [Monoraphidium neglectum]|uniref:Jacalin-type lectin domain-containing protein n=1 Tax=Monoraphidium neglectum TaxID=145388 RepID=A0A0D2LXV4_9CHLO|nr:hypothetical protein MNEG_11733 [Monoraphidium neglectum]KIY96229.1 hypothetical protein MNEG_11733 [Monoraphidium neglectum]|eukprot:XP_013895249.1 hypothetical protein MNEG_11733 [Monoraphidium neglectum]